MSNRTTGAWCYVFRRVSGKPAEAQAVVQIGIMIGNADGSFDQAEVAAAREACQALRLDPSQFGL